MKVQHFKLVKATFKLRGRDRRLFQVCTKAVCGKNEKRAVIYANELAEVRKILRFLKYAEIAIERVIIRLETIKELHAIVVDLKPALGALREVTVQLDELMPEVASELENVSESIQETLAVTTLDSPQPISPVNLKTPGGEKILEEASEFLGQKWAKQLPEPPKQLVIPEEIGASDRKEMVALTAACSQEAQRSEESSTRIFYKNMELRELSLKVTQPSSLEDILLDYAKERKGRIDINKCALELNRSIQEIERALENLNAQGRIRISS